MLQIFRERLTLILIALLPFHAFLVTVLTKWIEGPGHAPMGEIAIWKEGLLGLILLMAAVEVLRNGKWKMENGKFWKVDAIDILIILLIVIGFVVSIFNSQFSILNFAYGAKYDFIPLIAFLVLRRVDWTDRFKSQAASLLLWVGGIVAAYGILTFFLPAGFFHWLGYSDLHSLYVADGPLAAYQQIGGTSLRRIQSVMSGPNQLGVWLLLPLSLGLVKGMSERKKVYWFIGLLACLTALFLTFSRSAWIAATVIGLVFLWHAVPKQQLYSKKSLYLVSCLLLFLVAAAALFPQTILRVSSSRGHIEKPLEAIQTMVRHPLGLGLGSAGPASNRTSDTCVMLQEGDDPSWAADRPDLCVFVGDVQVQPEAPCNCPFLPENWYLQMGVEMGFIGMLMFIALVVMILKRLGGDEAGNQETRRPGDRGTGLLFSDRSWFLGFLVFWNPFSSLKTKNFVFLSFLGVSIAALFLHAWEDSAAAYTLWILVAAVLRSGMRSSVV